MAEDRLQNTINELLERANKAVLDSDWESVKKDSETVLKLDSSNQEAKTLLSLATKNFTSNVVIETKPTPEVENVVIETKPTPEVESALLSQIFWVVKNTISKTFNYRERASKKEFTIFIFFMFFIYGLGSIIDFKYLYYSDDGWGFSKIFLFLIFVLPVLSLSIRRLHDVESSGWWILILGPITNLVGNILNRIYINFWELDSSTFIMKTLQFNIYLSEFLSTIIIFIISYSLFFFIPEGKSAPNKYGNPSRIMFFNIKKTDPAKETVNEVKVVTDGSQVNKPLIIILTFVIIFMILVFAISQTGF